MDERSREGEGNQEGDLEYLKKQLETAETELRQVEAEREKVMVDLVAGDKNAAQNFNNYLRRVKDAEQKAIAALEAWGNAAAKFYKLED
jgi:uncharacterized protein (DUF3084 family)